ncbi:MAG: mechanosensitive ion channel [Proteobacteria bacterium]|nr:mechanosensitive ion channel [Pseudomonadota bacterium]
MDTASALYQQLANLVPVLLLAAGLVFGLWLTHRLVIVRRQDLGAEAVLPRQLLLLLLSVAAVIAVILMFPMSDTTRGQVLSLLGVVLTGVIALSSTTFVSNMMAGLMLRMIKSFRPGDFIHIGEKFGRVTERGLFHTEIQTEDRDLATFPNLYLITNPVTVVHSTGTVISATLSLSYDIAHAELEPLMKRAAEQAGLQDPFVLITDLGDFSVSYRVAGFLPEVKTLVTARSNLRKQLLDVLHGAGIEVLSPTYMAQRPVEVGEPVIPDPYHQNAAVSATTSASVAAAEEESTPEDIMFAKAEEISTKEDIKDEIARVHEQIIELAKLAQTMSDEEDEIASKRIIGMERYISMLNLRLNEIDKKK